MRQLPNFITLLNLFCGCVAVISILNGNLEQAGVLILAALLLDFLDGFLARLLNAYSPLGKQLDSLADMVSFGVVPGMVLYHLFLMSGLIMPVMDPTLFMAGKFYMFVVTLFSALRLAKFNIDPRQSDHFIGLPTPANTLLIFSLPFILLNDRFNMGVIILNPIFLFVFASISAWLLIAEIPLISLKFKSYDLKSNLAQYLLIAVSVISILVLKYAGIPVIILFYLILSLILPPVKKITS